MKHGARFSTWLGLILVIAACSHTRLPDTVDEGGGTGGAGGARANAGAGGVSGTGSGGRVGSSSAGRGTAGSATTPVTPAVRCGMTVCPVPGQTEYSLLATLASTFGLPLPSNGAGILPTACCTKSDNVCGLLVNSSCVPRPPSDPVCPDVMLLGVTEPGCCLEAQGVCGINGAQSGMGCMDVNSGINIFAGVTQPTPCGNGMPKTGDDGGVEPVDAGR